jgi:hypothetical protein
LRFFGNLSYVDNLPPICEVKSQIEIYSMKQLDEKIEKREK